jgi:phosphoribosyl-AMP cyclohydrolase
MTETSATRGMSRDRASEILDRVRFDDKGLLTTVVQQWDTKEVLMVGWMDREAFLRTMTEGRVTFWSRSRQEYWRKGDTSGHVQYVRGAALDCDGDTLLVRVEQIGAACHTGTRTCFDTDLLDPVVLELGSADRTAADRAVDPAIGTGAGAGSTE